MRERESARELMGKIALAEDVMEQVYVCILCVCVCV